MDQDHQHSQHQHSLQLLTGQGSPPSNVREQRRAVLWRERMQREFHMQGLIMRSTTLVQEWQRLHGSKAVVGDEASKLASHIVLAGFRGLQQHPSESQHFYEQDRIAQEEYRIQQDMLHCTMDIATRKRADHSA